MKLEHVYTYSVPLYVSTISICKVIIQKITSLQKYGVGMVIFTHFHSQIPLFYLYQIVTRKSMWGTKQCTFRFEIYMHVHIARYAQNFTLTH